MRSGMRWVALGLALDTAIALVDAAAQTGLTLMGLLMVGPLVASLRARPRHTAFVGVYALGVAVVLGVGGPTWMSADHAGRCAVVAIGSALAVWLASLRADRERALQRLSVQQAAASALVDGRDIGERRRADERLRKSRALLAEAEDVAQMGSWEWDVRSGELVFSEGLHQVLDIDPEMLGVRFEAVMERVHAHDREFVGLGLAQALDDHEPFSLDCRILPRDGTVRVVSTKGKVVLNDAGEPVKLVGTAQDVTERAKAEEIRERLASLVNSSADAILTKSPDGVITSWNRGAERLYGYTPAEAVGRPISMLIPSYRAADEDETLRTVLAGQPVHHDEAERVRKDGSTIVVSLTISPVRDANDRIAEVSVIARDITDRKRYEERLKHLADHDPLTDLLNRRRFEEELSRELAHAERHGSRGAVLSLDIDNFKAINDSGGHAAGDALVRKVASTLAQRLRSSDVLARLGGDEFGVLLRETNREDARAATEQLLETVRRCGVMVDGRLLRITGSAGVAAFGGQKATVEEVTIDADLALYEAKAAGRDRAVVYTLAQGRKARTRANLSWAQRIGTALERDRFVLYWQPILDLASNDVSHGELLLRMLDDDGELIPPSAFLPAAERYGLIHDIDRWVVRHAIRLIAERESAAPLRLGINLSGNSVVGDPGLPRLIQRELSEASVDASRVIFEITETAAIANMNEARSFAEQVSRLGCRLALDDFGTGFGSFYYLKHLPVDYVKMDGEFIRNLPRSRTDEHMVKAIVEVARGLGIKTVAEFVADEETIVKLREHHVDYAQGYHVGPPCPLAEMPSALAMSS
jgi:diguanylate cyclase (GGDEF)-like protein/PAS domain S-box-containing protein